MIKDEKENIFYDTLKKVSVSRYIIIPKKIVMMHGWKEGDLMEISITKKYAGVKNGRKQNA